MRCWKVGLSRDDLGFVRRLWPRRMNIFKPDPLGRSYSRFTPRKHEIPKPPLGLGQAQIHSGNDLPKRSAVAWR